MGQQRKEENTMPVFKCHHRVVLVILLMSLSLTACQPKPTPMEEFEASNQTEGQAPVVATEPSVFAPMQTGPLGAEPNPDAVFANLSDEARQDLLQWLERFAQEGGKLLQAGEVFSQKSAELLAQMAQGGQATANEAYQQFKTEALQALAVINGPEMQAMLSEKMLGLKDKVAAMASWYEAFFRDLEAQVGRGEAELTEFLKHQLGSLRERMQAVLDELAATGS